MNKQQSIQNLSVQASSTPVPAPGTISSILQIKLGSALLRKNASSLIPFARYGARKIGHAGIVGISLLIFSLVLLFTANAPLHERISSQSLELDSARSTASNRAQPGPENRQSHSAQQIVKELPSRNDLPIIMGQIVTIATASGLMLDRGNYEFSTTESNVISRYSLSLPVRGGYPQVREFIENTLATIPVMALESMRIERNEISDKNIAADLEFAILVGNGL